MDQDAHGRAGDRVRAISLAGLLLTGTACASPPPWKLPPGLESGARVRVVAPRLGRAWLPGRVQLSSAGCWRIEAAVTHDPDAITILAPAELSRLQLTRAVPAPDWWTIPEDGEGWNDIAPRVLEEAAGAKCRHAGG